MRFDYLIRRLGLYLLVIFFAVSINFLLPRVIPGDPLQQKLQMLEATSGRRIGNIDQMVQHYQAKFGIDKPLWKQFFSYWWDLLHLDLGYSLADFPTRVADIIINALPWSIGLMVTSTMIAFGAGMLLGALLAWPGTPSVARLSLPILMIFSAVPYFLLGLVLIFFLAIVYKFFPPAGAYSRTLFIGLNLRSITDILHHAILPSLSIVLSGIGFWALGMRGMMVSVLGEDFITMAESKGIKGRRIFLWYAMRNALLPQATALAMSLGFVVSGAVLVEVIFGYPGLGFQLFRAIGGKDYFVIQGIIALIIVSIGLALLIMDVIYPLIDPRIAYQRR